MSKKLFKWEDFQKFNAVAQKALVLVDVKYGVLKNRNIVDARDAAGSFEQLLPSDFMLAIREDINDTLYKNEMLIRSEVDKALDSILDEMESLVEGSKEGLLKDYVERFHPEQPTGEETQAE